MRVFYLDTSALIKHYVSESGTEWVDDTVYRPGDNLVLTSRITMVEAWSALARRRQEASISPQHHASALAAFREECVTRYRFVELGPAVVEVCGRLLEDHALRAYDAVQLASALVADQTLSAAGFVGTTFLCSDARLTTIARIKGMLTDNPNLHT